MSKMCIYDITLFVPGASPGSGLTHVSFVGRYMEPPFYFLCRQIHHLTQFGQQIYLILDTFINRYTSSYIFRSIDISTHIFWSKDVPYLTYFGQQIYLISHISVNRYTSTHIFRDRTTCLMGTCVPIRDMPTFSLGT